MARRPRPSTLAPSCRPMPDESASVVQRIDASFRRRRRWQRSPVPVAGPRSASSPRCIRRRAAPRRRRRTCSVDAPPARRSRSKSTPSSSSVASALSPDRCCATCRPATRSKCSAARRGGMRGMVPLAASAPSRSGSCATHKPLLGLAPDDVADLDATASCTCAEIDLEIVGIERNQLELVGCGHRTIRQIVLSR